jgi:hypothetical protein
MAKRGKVNEITKKSTDSKDKEFSGSGIEGTKEVVRGEDVLKILRKKGVKI